MTPAQKDKAMRDLLGDRIICERCQATLDSYADVCTADLDDPCPGFQAIEAALQRIGAGIVAGRL